MPGRSNGGEERKTFQYFSESNDKENEVQKHFREKRIRETWLSYILATLNHGSGEGGGGVGERENCPNSICHFVLFLHLVVKPLGMNVTIIPLNFIQKSRPYACPSYRSKTITISLR